MSKTKLELISDIDMHLFVEKGTRGSVFDIKDTVKPIINTGNVMIIKNQVNISCIWTQIICMVGSIVNIFLTVNLNG